jgi:hypothetical protein
VRNYKLGLGKAGIQEDRDEDDAIDERGRSLSLKDAEFIN